MNNRKTGNILISFGLIVILCATTLTIYNLREDYMANITAQNTMAALIDTVSSAESDITDDLLIPEIFTDPLKEMPVQTIDGMDYVGFIEIPKLNVYLPVAAESNDSNLKIAPCRFYGTTYHNNFVIGAHNYRSHFGYLYKLTYDDTVKFTDMDGITTEYFVADIETLEADQGTVLCSGEWPLSLYTCTFSGEKRLVLRCEKV